MFLAIILQKNQYSLYDYSTSLLLRTVNFTTHKTSNYDVNKKNPRSLYNSLDNIDNVLTICYVLLMCTHKREGERERKGERREVER